MYFQWLNSTEYVPQHFCVPGQFISVVHLWGPTFLQTILRRPGGLGHIPGFASDSITKQQLHKVSVIFSRMILLQDWGYLCFPYCMLGGGQNGSHITLLQKSESRHRSCSHFATPMIVLHRSWANDLETNGLIEILSLQGFFCRAIVRKDLNSLATF